jgi:UDP-N-acetylmuramyl pentapeptide phosphotransferase/UDP-N-acetylglucosamine-1-phosphate transferase
MQLFLLVALAGSFILALLFCGIALRLAPNFRSGERKEGFFRADQSLGSSGAVSNSKSNSKGGRRRHAPSSELPLVGSVGMIPAMLLAGAGTGWLLHFDASQWLLLGILGASLVGFWLVGQIDDWKKVYSGRGVREITKFIGVAIVAVGVALAFYRYIPSAATAYSPYTDVPGLGTLLLQVRYAWPVFFVLLVLTVSSTTSLAVDFADGLDGLAAGLSFPAALAFAVIILAENRPDHYPLVIVSLALAGATMGFLPWNWPSSWKGRSSLLPRRARMIMGDSGSLALGGMLAIIALLDRQELLLVLIGGVFVLEGLSAVIQSRLLVRFFRHFLKVERFEAEHVWFPHTEYPLPFLATPMHHHFDLLGWDRRRLVYSAWTIAALFGALGIASALAPFTWQRYLARFMALLIGIALWQSGHHTRGYFLGTVNTAQGPRIGIFYGYPYKLFGRRMYSLVELTEATDKNVTSPVEQCALWVRMNLFDARAALGFFCYRAGYYSLAREQWERIPNSNLAVRPQIMELLTDARRRVAPLGASPNDSSVGTIATAMGAEPSPADISHPGLNALVGPNTRPTHPNPLPTDAAVHNAAPADEQQAGQTTTGG